MASPLGHALAGWGVGRLATPADPDAARIALACGLLAVAPDLDFVPGVLLGQPALFHQGASHSLGVAVLVAGCAALAFGTRAPTGRLWLLFLAAYATHLGLDLLGPDARAPIGIPLFWPASDATFLAPVALLPGIAHAETTRATNAEWLAGIVSAANLRALGIEVAVVAPLLLGVEWVRRSGAARAARGRT